jgi:FSR family fosmidomycin resistance protein-like MFS transporter
LAAVAGTFAGGPIGDKIGRKAWIWGVFCWHGAICFNDAVCRFILDNDSFRNCRFGVVSAFAAMVVYAQEAVPGRVGMISGLMFGLMFGVSGIAAAGLGHLADINGIEWVFKLCSYLPLLGLATFFLPKTHVK